MTASPKPMLAIVATNSIDEDQVLARLVVVEPGKEPRVLSTHFTDTTHAQAILAAVGALVSHSLTRGLPMRIIVPDQTVVQLLQGSWHTKSRQIGRQVAHIRHLVCAQKAPVTFERGTVRSALGTMADLIDLW